MAKLRPVQLISSTQAWEHLPEEALLGWRIRDLGLRIAGSPLEPRIRCLYEELARRGIGFRPACYLADEWFCPNRVPVIGIPFCLAHPRLQQLEQRMMLEVEGGTATECMKLLRHEAGHAMNYAYVLHRRTRWRELFGRFSERYATTYRFHPYSRRYVLHLDDNYAQAHPDEDFAETFAVWLTPDSRWEEKYGDWPVIDKLRYIDKLMQRIGGRPPLVTGGEMPWAANRMTSTLAAYYHRKRVYLGDDYPGYYDVMLRRLFPETGATDKAASACRASRFLRRHQRAMVDSVAAWTGRRKYDVYQLMTKLIRRCDALGLCVSTPDTETAVDVAAFVTAVANQLDRYIRGHGEE